MPRKLKAGLEGYRKRMAPFDIPGTKLTI